MAGVPVSYTWATADVVEWYDDNPGAVFALYLPANWATQARTSVAIFMHGGGWTPSSYWLDVTHTPSRVLLSGDYATVANALLALGWAVVFATFPHGWTSESVRYYPCARHPQIQRMCAGLVQHLKDRAAAKRGIENITGDAAHSLATDGDQYVVIGVSSGSMNMGWSIAQPDGALPYVPPEATPHRFQWKMRRHSHRVKAAVLWDLMAYFPFYDPDAGISPNLIQLFGSVDQFTDSSKIREIPLAVLHDASMLPYIEQDHPENRDIALCVFAVGTYGTGHIMGNPSLTADAFRALAAPRTPIAGMNDPHELGPAILLEDALKTIAVRKGVAWEQEVHRIVWGNGANNPLGLHWFDNNTGFATQGDFAVDWITNVLQIPPYV